MRALFLLLFLAPAAFCAATDTIAATDPSVATDSTLPGSAGEADTVRYSARAIRYFRAESLLVLIGDAELGDGDMRLQADTILFHTGRRELTAMGTPVLKDASGLMVGERMVYRLNEKRGRITYGTARAQGDIYNGEAIGRMEDNSFLVRNGDFSTCDADTAPHFFFFSEKMRITPNDKIAAKPVVLNIADVPVGVLPYFVFPIRRGRQSGILTPRFGQFSDNGEQASYLNNVGYYFAINDYTDLEARMDFSNGDGYFFQRVYANADFSYRKRYWLDGYLNARMNVSRSDESTARDYGLSYSHNQNLLPDRSFYLRGSGEIVGNSNYYRESTLDRRDYLKRRLSSNMALAKSWSEQGLSTNLNMSYQEDLDTKENSMNLPSFSFSSVQRTLPFARKADEEGLPLPGDSLYWYEKIRYQYGTRGTNIYRKTREQRYDLLDSAYDTSSYRYKRWNASDMRHDLSFSLSPAPKLGYLNVSPFLNTSSNWFFKENRRGAIKSIDTLKYGNARALDTNYYYDTVSAFNHREEFATGVNLSTQLYGTSLWNVGRLAGFRHVLQPGVSYTYSPELKDGERYISAGTASNANRDKQQRVGMSAGNTFQMKIKGDPEMENSGDRTLTLMNLNAGTGYNFTAKNRAGVVTGRWDDLGSNASTSLYALDLNYNGTHSFYDLNDQFIPSRKGALLERLPRLRRYSLSAGTGANLTGRVNNGSLKAYLSPEDSSAMNPWNIGMSFNYTFTKQYNDRFRVFETANTFSLRDNFTLRFTDNWSMTYNSIYDFKANELVDQSINMTRDFHCWEAVFDWVLNGYRSGFYFRINIKEIPDVKFEKRSGAYGPYSGSGFGMPFQGSYY